jgi:shikimate kinase
LGKQILKNEGKDDPTETLLQEIASSILTIKDLWEERNDLYESHKETTQNLEDTTHLQKEHENLNEKVEEAL